MSTDTGVRWQDNPEIRRVYADLLTKFCEDSYDSGIESGRYPGPANAGGVGYTLESIDVMDIWWVDQF